MATKNRSSRKFVITPADHGDTLEMGPAGTSGTGGLMAIQFIPDGAWNGSSTLLARVLGQAAQAAGAPFMPLSYRRVTVNNVASDYAIVSDPITGATTIYAPSNGLSLGLLISCSAGSCTVVSWPVTGQFPI